MQPAVPRSLPSDPAARVAAVVGTADHMAVVLADGSRWVWQYVVSSDAHEWVPLPPVPGTPAAEREDHVRQALRQALARRVEMSVHDEEVAA